MNKMLQHSTNSLSSPPMSHQTSVQLIRSISCTHHIKSPFQKKSKFVSNTCLQLKFSEFANYKILESEKCDESEENIDVPDVKHNQSFTNQKNINLEIASPLSVNNEGCCLENFHEMEEEAKIELLIGKYITSDMEREINLLACIAPITLSEITPKLVKLQEPTQKLTLVLDLDETLFHTIRNNNFPLEYKDRALSVSFYSSTEKRNFTIKVLKRPFLDDFLKYASKYYEIIAFTASEKEYADAVLQEIDTSKLIRYRLYRDSCIPRGKYLIKDLRILGRDLSNIVIVDNSITSFMSQIENGVPIRAFFDNCDDHSLADVAIILKGIYDSKVSVMEFLKSIYCLEEVIRRIQK